MITKLELIEYLKNTPENTNYNILRSGLYNGSNKEAVDEFIAVLSRGNLSLAALQPYLAKLYKDDGSISPPPLPPIPTPGSGGQLPKEVTSSIETHGMGWEFSGEKEGFNIEWNGNREGLDNVDYMYFRVADIPKIQSVDEFIGATVVSSGEGAIEPYTIEGLETYYDGLYVDGKGEIAVVTRDISLEGVAVPKGIYFAHGDFGSYVSQLYREPYHAEELHTIDKKYLPVANLFDLTSVPLYTDSDCSEPYLGYVHLVVSELTGDVYVTNWIKEAKEDEWTELYINHTDLPKSVSRWLMLSKEDVKELFGIRTSLRFTSNIGSIKNRYGDFLLSLAPKSANPDFDGEQTSKLMIDLTAQ